ncbi:hypothetical protein P9112_005932 [Eukaryota sp. TZLM1-RC]
MGISHTSCFTLMSDIIKQEINSISASHHTLILTNSGYCYGCGSNTYNNVFFSDLSDYLLPIKLPVTNIRSIAAGFGHSLALTVDGEVYAWGSNIVHEINSSNNQILPIINVQLPYLITQVFASNWSSFALTIGGYVLHWGNGVERSIIKGLSNVVFLDCFKGNFVCGTSTNELFLYYENQAIDTFVLENVGNFEGKSCCGFTELAESNIFHIAIINLENIVFEVTFNFQSKTWSNPVFILGLNNVKSIKSGEGFFVALTTDGSVFYWGNTSRLFQNDDDVYSFSVKPITSLENIEGISVGPTHLFAFNGNCVYAVGQNYFGQLGTGDYKNEVNPLVVLGSETCGIFEKSTEFTMNLFPHLIKTVLLKILDYYNNNYSNAKFVKTMFLSKYALSKQFFCFCSQLLSTYSFRNHFLNICDLGDIKNSKVTISLCTQYFKLNQVNNVITDLHLITDTVEHLKLIQTKCPNLLSFSISKGDSPIDHMTDFDFLNKTKLRYIQINYPILDFPKLPSSLTKLVVSDESYLFNRGRIDLSYLYRLKDVTVSGFHLSNALASGLFLLPPIVSRLTIEGYSLRFGEFIKFPMLKELVLIVSFYQVHNVKESCFPSLSFLQFKKIGSGFNDNPQFCPIRLNKEGRIKSVVKMKHGFLTALLAFPYWIQYCYQKEVEELFI